MLRPLLLLPLLVACSNPQTAAVDCPRSTFRGYADCVHAELANANVFRKPETGQYQAALAYLEGEVAAGRMSDAQAFQAEMAAQQQYQQAARPAPIPGYRPGGDPALAGMLLQQGVPRSAARPMATTNCNTWGSTTNCTTW